MKILGQTEFLEYLYAEKGYDELIYEQRLRLTRIYDDVCPTITGFDYDGGRIFSTSINVADYAIAIVEVREWMEKERIKQFRKVCVYRQAFERLNPVEQAMIEQYKANGLTTQIQGIQAVLERFRGILESILSKQIEPVEKVVHMEDVILLEKIAEHRKSGRKQYMVDGRFQYMTEAEFMQKTSEEAYAY